VAAVNVGVFGGAFDPPHRGHVALAEGGIEHFRLDRLLVRVVARPAHKEVATPPDIRLRLAELSFEPFRGVQVELDPYARTVDSLEALELDDPVFLVGADELASFLEWKDPERVLALARLGVGTRPGVEREGLEAVLAALDRPERVTFFPIEPHTVSSSELRARARAGEPIDAFVPAAVAAEIAVLGLYRDVETGEGRGMLGDDSTRTERTTPT
jgi:nicotinate-nucleotide adenylyltransferase